MKRVSSLRGHGKRLAEDSPIASPSARRLKIQGADTSPGLRDMLAEFDAPPRAGALRRGERVSAWAGDLSQFDRQVWLAAHAVELTRLQAEIAGMPEVRGALVDRLRDEITDGRYRPDGPQIADALMKEQLP